MSKDGDVVCIEDYFILYNIDSEDDFYENFDSIINFKYIINRLRTKKNIYEFEMNSKGLQNFGFVPLNVDSNRIVMRLQSGKLIKEIHHYSKKIQEYSPFYFKVVGEISIMNNGYSIKPFVIWR